MSSSVALLKNMGHVELLKIDKGIDQQTYGVGACNVTAGRKLYHLVISLGNCILVVLLFSKLKRLIRVQYFSICPNVTCKEKKTKNTVRYIAKFNT